jgi:hypothetical protein
MAWMPANPWVSRLQQKIAKYLENHDKVFWSWPYLTQNLVIYKNEV